MGRAKSGEAINPRWRTDEHRNALRGLMADAKAAGDLPTWRRAKAVLGYLDGRRVIALSQDLDVTRGSINRWLQWFDARGVDGLRSKPHPGGAPLLTEAQRDELTKVVEAGPLAAGFRAGIWTGPMIGDWIRRHFGVHYHNHYVPRLLHRLGFSVQRPRKRLARADAEAQSVWLRKTFPAIKKKPRRAEESSSSRTRPASGSTGPSTERGPE